MEYIQGRQNKSKQKKRKEKEKKNKDKNMYASILVCFKQWDNLEI